MEKLKYILKMVGIYLGIYLVCTVLFVLLFHTGFLGGIDVLMYRGLVFIVILGIVAVLMMWGVRKLWKRVDVRDIIMMFLLFCCVNTVLFTLIPVTVERSVSVFMLSYMEENDDRAFTKDEIEEVFTEKYVKEYGAFEKRFAEQITTGSIVDNGDGTYSITGRGKRLVGMFRTVAEWFDTERNIVYPGGKK